jgi:hypothetical protein
MHFVTAAEAAKLIDISKRQFHRDVRHGLVRKYFQNGSKRAVYDMEEVEALKEIKRNGLSYRKVAMMAVRAQLSSERSNRAVQQVMDLMGLNLPLLDLSEEAVVTLHIKAKEDYSNPRVLKPQEVKQWTRLFYTMGPEYFDAVELYTREEHPYMIYIQLGMKLTKDVPTRAARRNSELLAIYGSLQSARRVLEHSAFFYSHRKDGHVLACTLFPDIDGDLHEQILALAPD